MDDQKLIELYWQRSEKAIAETAIKYGNYCYRVAYNILANNEDSEECVNDTYFKVWEEIPPTRPNRFSAFIGKIVRRLAINRYEYLTAVKRGGSQVPLALEELRDCMKAFDRGNEQFASRILDSLVGYFLNYNNCDHALRAKLCALCGFSEQQQLISTHANLLN